MGPGASVVLLALLFLLRLSACQPGSVGDYTGDSGQLLDLEQVLLAADKRGCIRRGGNCDQRPKDCCDNSACRCNLWGSNCRCQRMGLFQQWGK
uniref:Agatoxin-like n=1 Tax=Carausius morosus TaxID=7022 RepID=A0A6G4ZWG8_CARMO|nr:agatoxin-like protein [Carausius morosus]